jgi:hypothetical protein
VQTDCDRWVGYLHNPSLCDQVGNRQDKVVVVDNVLKLNAQRNGIPYMLSQGVGLAEGASSLLDYSGKEHGQVNR